MDWDDLRYIHAIARHGSLGRAAKALGSTQPTVGRRLAGVEARLGVKLFERALNGLQPTELGAALTESLDQMEECALGVERRIAARDTGLQGLILVTTLDWLGDRIVAPAAAEFGRLHPFVSVEVVNDPRLYNLSRREADIAIRFAPFHEESLYQRRIADVTYGLYASPVYLERLGLPDFEAGCDRHPIITLHEGAGRVCQVDWLMRLAPNAPVALRASGVHGQMWAAEAGHGMAALPRVLGDGRPGLARIPTPLPEPSQGVWLGVHAEMREVPRIRAFIDFMVQALCAPST
ncbi:LysR family transcriptional regulator [Ralstonia mannitolilytica]|uniref:HTH-type transcriptional regulator PgrR n=1 Tax=Ralstonia mannitolilytica TaxID=105219 RepID=A0AAD2AIU0_9RALS|nr:LysR family transcriptional regulator [Ralstonia mannitolilytica]MBY4721376.1 LysR family transcriptional regulator [Ralstonia mannitolilytica]CAJ0679654.1 HTH-type transcriptional regulator PgrR [Ralstonia mannitolilytica]CAJ0698586.1 HTH-type transcriptional regulator PgrR [Ralstonia mannitolilytica]CAJ0852812.1 HTH-type transcriptional regulator PgrR [Ralstonia mannitolilytica]